MTNEARKARELEIFNSMPHNTFDEVMEVAQAVNNYRKKCENYDEALEECDSEIERYKERVIEKYEHYSTFKRFVSSKVGKLIADFITKKNVTFEEIEKEISESGNPFDIEIIKEKQHYDHEVYGPVNARFNIYSIERFYYLNKWDADEDGESIFRCLNHYMKKYDSSMQRKEEIERDGVDTLWCYELEWGDGWYWRYNGEDVSDYGENCGISDESEIEEWMRSRNIQVKEE